jgi:hypothetical protein
MNKDKIYQIPFVDVEDFHKSLILEFGLKNEFSIVSMQDFEKMLF